MVEWRKQLSRLASRVEARIGEERQRLGLGDARPIRIEAYRGFGTGRRMWVKGRVLRGAPLPRPRESDTLWQNLSASFQRFESDEVPGARVRVRYPGGERELVSDREGYLECWLEPGEFPAGSGLWYSLEMELLDPPGAGFRAEAPVLVPPPGAAFGVISDLDDTVLRSDVASKLRLARNIALGNAHTRLPFPGVAAFYRGLHGGADGKAGNPFFYVSSSPWNLYDVLCDFLELRHIPSGPLLLRDWGISPAEPGPTGHATHKTRHIETILDLYPRLPFILVGDSGQEDPEIYHRVVHAYPRRIRAVYIRNVSRHPQRAEAIQALAREVEAAGSTLLLADDTLAAARHAATQGWLDPTGLRGVEEAVAAEG